MTGKTILFWNILSWEKYLNVLNFGSGMQILMVDSWKRRIKFFSIGRKERRPSIYSTIERLLKVCNNNSSFLGAIRGCTEFWR